MPEPQSLFGPPSPTELQIRLEAERAGTPFLLYRDQDGAQVIVRLETQTFPFTIGRDAESRLCIEWERRMSRVHADIISLGAEYAILDDGLSRNGSFLNGKRVAGRTRLRDNDVLRLGQTMFLYRAPTSNLNDSTAIGTAIPIAAQISPAQRRVLVALARPFDAAEGGVTPATNQQIASELFLSVEAVKTHLRALGVKLGVQGLPQNQKRATLVERALTAGVLTPRDLDNEARNDRAAMTENRDLPAGRAADPSRAGGGTTVPVPTSEALMMDSTSAPVHNIARWAAGCFLAGFGPDMSSP